MVFDFDGTLTTHDTFARFLRYHAGALGWTLRIIALLPIFIGYKVGVVDRHAVKYAVCRRFFRNVSVQKLENAAKRYAQDIMPDLFRSAARTKLAAEVSRHTMGETHLLICSASIGPYLRHFLDGFGIGADQILACELEERDTLYTGELEGYNVWGDNKVRRIRDWAGSQRFRIIAAYGDSKGDVALLETAQVAHWNPFT